MKTDNDRAQAYIETTARQIATDEAVLGIKPVTAIVPPGVQAPTYDPDLLRKLPSAVIEAERVISGYFNSTDGKHWEFGGIQKRVAAPIVATVPSTSIENAYFSAATGKLTRVDIIADGNLVTLHVAAPSPTEQASDVRNAALEEAAASFDGFGRFQTTIQMRIRSLKSATPADKGNATAEGKS